MMILTSEHSDGYAAVFKRNYPALPVELSGIWGTSWYITANGGLEGNAWQTISGFIEEKPDRFGVHHVKRPAPNYMQGIWSDVPGPAQVVRGNSKPGSYLVSYVNDANGQECARIGNDGRFTVPGIKIEEGASGIVEIGSVILTIKSGIITGIAGVTKI